MNAKALERLRELRARLTPHANGDLTAEVARHWWTEPRPNGAGADQYYGTLAIIQVTRPTAEETVDVLDDLLKRCPNSSPVSLDTYGCGLNPPSPQR